MLTRRSFLQSFVTVGTVAGLGLPCADAVLAAPRTWRQTQLFMGTMVELTIAGTGQQQAEDVIALAIARGRALEGLFSRFDSTSPVTILNAQGSLGECPAEWQAVMDGAASVHARSGGAFDMTVLPLLRLMEQTHGRPCKAELQETLRLVEQGRFVRTGQGWRFTNAGMGLTLDGIAKGHIAQEMSAVLTGHGCPNHMVNAGGDIVAHGTAADGQPWRVGIADPGRKGRHVRTLSLARQGGAVATSGISEFRFDSRGRCNHLLLPQTGASSTFASVTVAAPTGLEADALATACAVMAPGDALRLVRDLGEGHACVLLARDGRILAS